MGIKIEGEMSKNEGEMTLKIEGEMYFRIEGEVYICSQDSLSIYADFV